MWHRRPAVSDFNSRASIPAVVYACPHRARVRLAKFRSSPSLLRSGLFRGHYVTAPTPSSTSYSLPPAPHTWSLRTVLLQHPTLLVPASEFFPAAIWSGTRSSCTSTTAGCRHTITSLPLPACWICAAAAPSIGSTPSRDVERSNLHCRTPWPKERRRHSLRLIAVPWYCPHVLPSSKPRSSTSSSTSSSLHSHHESTAQMTFCVGVVPPEAFTGARVPPHPYLRPGFTFRRRRLGQLVRWVTSPVHTIFVVGRLD
ncbi:hypothetical protein C8F04DRAFT_426122 [Mycena alexandri]|uniref:Uncharacterized protein n=1 Tax=Mycena alexandri TaxID=1745969 RepID=A0AAD6WM57_9AGAR|nr:hypothetical protein C8F04DRAFT_426122 [Mycena alexandri]